MIHPLEGTAEYFYESRTAFTIAVRFVPLRPDPHDSTCGARNGDQLQLLIMQAHSPRASLVLGQEDLVEADGVAYRRVRFGYGDEATLTMHGACGQTLYVWLAASGEVAGICADSLGCPI